MIDEKEKTALVPLPLDGIGVAEPGEAAAPLLFRGLPIAWAVCQESRRAVEENAFGPDNIGERPGRKKNLMEYGGQPYTREEFYRAVF